MNNHVTDKQIRDAYALAKERYARLGVDTDAALKALATIPLSLHCWQGDDIGGYEARSGELGGGLATTGNYPGKARTPDELRRDLDKVYALIPGRHRLALHAIYAETGGARVARNELQPAHFDGWIAWAREKGHGLDFNPTLFGHPLAASGMTLASYDEGIRKFWIEHCIACRLIGEHMGRELGTPCVNNLWIADGIKDTPADRKAPRELLKDSLDKIFARPIDRRYNLDSVEGKLFGLGSESYVVGSHEFYLGYAITRKVLLTLDSGHFHPTETIADKLSAVLLYVDEMLLHVSRGIRWDSDHVVTLTDDLQAIGQELDPRRLPGPGAHRAGLLRRQHQPDRGVRRRRAQHAARPAAGAVGADRRAARARARRRLFRPAGSDRGVEGAAVRRGLGRLLPDAGRAGGRELHGRNPSLRADGVGAAGVDT